MNLSRLFLWLLVIAGAVGICYNAACGQVQAPSFDKLNDADRQAFGERFQREIWPLLVKGGKDGCVGCHNGKKGPALRFRGDPMADFRMLLKDGFFLKDDPGSLLDRVVEKNRKRRMPPDKLPPWTAEPVRVLREFVHDLDKKNGK
jgi:hypothetical protein